MHQVAKWQHTRKLDAKSATLGISRNARKALCINSRYDGKQSLCNKRKCDGLDQRPDLRWQRDAQASRVLILVALRKHLIDQLCPSHFCERVEEGYCSRESDDDCDFDYRVFLERCPVPDVRGC